MGGLSKSLSGMFGALVPVPGMGLPPLPGGLGLPEKPVPVGQGFNQGKNPKDPNTGAINSQIEKANVYNKAFADLLNGQPQLDGSQRRELYAAYSVGAKDTHKGARPTDFSGGLSWTTPDQFHTQQPDQPPAPQQPTQQQPQAAAPAPAPSAPAPRPVTVGPTPTPTTTSPSGNIAGNTTTTVSASGEDSKNKSSGRRGRMQTLLTGLGGAVEKFGL